MWHTAVTPKGETSEVGIPNHQSTAYIVHSDSRSIDKIMDFISPLQDEKYGLDDGKY